MNQEDPNVHTQNIESLWSCLKRFLRSKNLNNRERIENYLAEFTFRKRFNSFKREELFLKLIEIIFE